VDTVGNVRKRCVPESVERAPERNERESRRPRKLDGAGEARPVAGSGGKPPEGRARRTLRVLAELEVVDAITAETARQTLERTTSSRGRSSIAAIPG